MALHASCHLPPRAPRRAAFLLLVALGCSASCRPPAADGQPSGDSAADAWVTPDALAAELASPGGADAPVVVFTGPPFLYRIGRIPGAVARGPASTPQGLADLKAWAEPLPRSTNLVVYCGCCPLADCPNLAPASAALGAMGFTRVRLLRLPSNFGTDWVQRGYPVAR